MGKFTSWYYRENTFGKHQTKKIQIKYSKLLKELNLKRSGIARGVAQTLGSIVEMICHKIHHQY